MKSIEKNFKPFGECDLDPGAEAGWCMFTRSNPS